MIPATRVFLPRPSHVASANAVRRVPAEAGSWVWHPDRKTTSTAVLRFRLPFTLKEDSSPIIHITADQRFQLRCDGQEISFGPDRCDLDHWTVQTLQLELSTGIHELEVLAWFIGDEEEAGLQGESKKDGSTCNCRPPMAQMSGKAGFLFYADGAFSSLLSTGVAPWTVEDLTLAVGMRMPIIPHYIDVGPEFIFDMHKWGKQDVKPAKLVVPPLQSGIHGVRRPGVSLYPCDIPEQERILWCGGNVRAVRNNWDELAILPAEVQAPEIKMWQKLIDAKTPLALAPHTSWTVIWDLENYTCGYPVLRTQSGEGTVIEWSWAEALYQESSTQTITDTSGKGNRGEVENKAFIGYGDMWSLGPEPMQEPPALWWRCGRYCRIRIKTGATALILKQINVNTTGYPLQFDGWWKSSDKDWDNLMPLFERCYQVSAHETWSDSPYYEQMSYVGDDTLHCLSSYAWISDIRLTRRVLQLLEWSRHASGLVAERYPSGWRQESPTFSLLWVTMIRNHTMWCDDAPFIKSIIPGMRSVLAEFDGLVQEDGLLHDVPGWAFIDWVPAWQNGAGCGPGVREGDSSIVNLHWVLALLAASQVEAAHGDPSMAQRYQEMARTAFDKILLRYWDNERGILLDTVGCHDASEHAQMFALLSGLLDVPKSRSCLSALLKREGLAQTTIYASFYLLEALYQHGKADEFFQRLEFWRGLLAQGFTATPEGPEPSRSDAHAWGAHPAWHTLASIAGVRPASPGFASVKIAPLLGRLEYFDARVVHPKGFVEVNFRRQGAEGANFTLKLPDGIIGSLYFKSKSIALYSGQNEIILA